MKERLKMLRNKKELTQQEFSNRLGIQRSTYSKYELGTNEPTDAVINLICDRFKVNEKWLRTGEGEMFVEVSRDDELLRLIDDSMTEESGEFKRRLAMAIMRLSPEQISACRDWIKENLNLIEPDPKKNEIERKVEEYRAELEAEAASGEVRSYTDFCRRKRLKETER